jgi:hypothetical protein
MCEFQGVFAPGQTILGLGLVGDGSYASLPR